MRFNLTKSLWKRIVVNMSINERIGAIAGKVKLDKVKQINVRKIYCRGIYLVCKSAGKVLHHKG